MLIRFSCRNDPDHCVVFAVAVAHNENAKLEAHTQHDKSFLILRMVGIEESHGVLVKKYGLRLFKGNAMFFDVFPVFIFIPLKAQAIHTYSVCTLLDKVNTDLKWCCGLCCGLQAAVSRIDTAYTYLPKIECGRVGLGPPGYFLL